MKLCFHTVIMFQIWGEFTLGIKCQCFPSLLQKIDFFFKHRFCPFQGNFIDYIGCFYALPIYVSTSIQSH